MKFNVVAIEREFASGGRDTAKILAEKLGFDFYDREILRLAAEKIGSTVDNIGHMDEKVPNSFLYSLYAMSVTGRAFDTSNVIPKENVLQREEEKLIKEFADKGNCIIIGRCAGPILSGRSHVLKVFITAELEERKKRAVELYNMEPSRADQLLKNHDKNRSMYYKFYSGKNWDDKSEYHMILDSGKLGTEKCADIIISAMK